MVGRSHHRLGQRRRRLRRRRVQERQVRGVLRSAGGRGLRSQAPEARFGGIGEYSRDRLERPGRERAPVRGANGANGYRR